MHCTLPRRPSRSARRRHDLKGVAEDHPVRPVLRRAGRTRSCRPSGRPLKSANRSICVGCRLPGLRLALEVVDQRLGVDLLLDVERRRMDDEVAPVLLVLAAPDELRVEVAVAALVGDADGRTVFAAHTDWYSAVGMFLRVASSCVRVSTIFFGVGFAVLPSFCSLLLAAAAVDVTDSIIFLNSLSTRSSKSASIRRPR